jgi:uncharacterized membrane protein HdeD (DUF308 family)
MSNEAHDLPSAAAVTPLSGKSASREIISFRHELHHVRSHWHWFLFLGIIMLVGGVLSLASPFVASVVAIDILAVVLQIAGIVTIVSSFFTGKWGAFLVHMLVGMLYLMAGLIIPARPLVSILVATIFISASFMLMGLFRILAAMTIRFPQWGWMLLNGAITFILGLAIYRHLPQCAVWVIGLLIGVELLFSGWTWIMLALEIRTIAD